MISNLTQLDTDTKTKQVDATLSASDGIASITVTNIISNAKQLTHEIEHQLSSLAEHMTIEVNDIRQ
jgi:hypothetical protein